MFVATVLRATKEKTVNKFPENQCNGVIIGHSNGEGKVYFPLKSYYKTMKTYQIYVFHVISHNNNFVTSSIAIQCNLESGALNRITLKYRL